MPAPPVLTPGPTRLIQPGTANVYRCVGKPVGVNGWQAGNSHGPSGVVATSARNEEIATIVARGVLHAIFGMGGDLAKLAVEINRRLAKDTGWTGNWRVLTDLSGSFDTVVLEIEVERLAA